MAHKYKCMAIGKVTSVKSLQNHNDSLNGTGLEKATARFTDAETLELDTLVKKNFTFVVLCRDS